MWSKSSRGKYTMYGLLLCLFRSVAALRPFQFTSKLEDVFGVSFSKRPLPCRWVSSDVLHTVPSDPSCVFRKRMSMSTRLSFLTSRLASQRVCAEFLWASIITSISFDDVDYVCGFHSSSSKRWSYGHLTGKGKPPKFGKQQEPQCLFVILCTVNVGGPGKIYIFIYVILSIYLYYFYKCYRHIHITKQSLHNRKYICPLYWIPWIKNCFHRAFK